MSHTTTLTERISRQLLEFQQDRPQDIVSLSASLRQAERTLKQTDKDPEGEDDWIRLLRHYELGALVLGWKHP